MGAHANGNGDTWQESNPDIDQPHGKDYLELQDIRKGVRKRMEQEHTTFADVTVGGIHKPGGAAVLGIEDGTPGAADGTYRGHGIVWDNSSRLWCSTAVAGASTSGDQTVVLLHPDKQWGGGDITWNGQHLFTEAVDFSAVDISDSLDVTGQIACGTEIVGEASASFTGGVDISQTLACASSLTVADGTAVFSTNVDVSADVDISGTLAVDTITSTYVPIWCSFCGDGGAADLGAGDWTGVGVNKITRISEGIYEVSFSSAMDYTDYGTWLTGQRPSSSDLVLYSLCHMADSCRIRTVTINNAAADTTRVSAMFMQ